MLELPEKIKLIIASRPDTGQARKGCDLRSERSNMGKYINTKNMANAFIVAKQKDHESVIAFVTSYAAYQSRYAVLEASKDQDAKGALEECFRALSKLNTVAKAEGCETMFKKYIRTVREKEATIEEFRQYVNEVVLMQAMNQVAAAQ